MYFNLRINTEKVQKSSYLILQRLRINTDKFRRAKLLVKSQLRTIKASYDHEQTLLEVVEVT